MKRPFLNIFIFYLAGIIFFTRFKLDINLIKILFLLKLNAFIIVFMLKRDTSYIKYIVLCLIFFISIININHKTQNNSLTKLYGEKIKAVGIIKEVVSKEKEYEKYILHINKAKYKGNTYTIDEKLILAIYEETDIDLGDKVLTNIEIKEPNTNTNPKLFNYKLYLESKNIFATSSSKKANIEILSKSNLNYFEQLSIKIKDEISSVLDKSLTKENSSIIKSIILGDDSFLSEEYINSFRKLGLSHILAVSGLHIGIIFGFLIYVLDLLKVHRKISMVISIIIIWIYACLIGFPASVLRASIMFSFLIIGKLVHKRYDSLNTLSLTGLILLIYRPLWVFSVGFQLSFIATFTILLFLPYMNRIINIKNKKIKTALVIVLTAQIGVLPISMYYFNELQTLSLIANLIIAPILTIGIITGFLIILTSLISIKISIIIGFFGNIILNTSNSITNTLVELTSLNISIKSPSYIEIVFYYLALFVILRIIDIREMDKCFQNCIYINFLVAIVIGIFINSSQDNISLEFIDVGQGDACLVRLKDKNILIDTGGNIFGDFDIGENILLPYLKKTGVKTLDAVFLSHFHADHVKGLIPLFENIDIKDIFIGYESLENPLYEEIIKSSKENDVTVNLVTIRNGVNLDKTSSIEVLHPPKDTKGYEGENDKSLVFVLKVYNREVLFTGDIEQKSEDYIVKNNDKRKVDVIKVPHHGSKTSSKKELIEHFDPKVAIIQLGKNNFGHPNQDVLKRYSDNKTKVLRNDISGLIKVEITKENMNFDKYLKNKTSFLEYISLNSSIILYILYSGTILLLMLKYIDMKIDKL